MKKYILGWITCLMASVVWVGAQTNVALVTNTAAATNVAAAPVRAAAKSGSYLGLIIWGAVIIGVFAFLWYKGYLVKMRNYVAETQEELRKCSWPTREELKGSTVVVMVTIAILGLFTVGVDWILSNLMRLIT